MLVQRQGFGLVLLIALLTKIIWEQTTGDYDEAMVKLIDIPVAVNAHAWGLATGALLGLGLKAWRAQGNQPAK